VATEREVMLAYLGAPTDGTSLLVSPSLPAVVGTTGDLPAGNQTGESLAVAPGPESSVPTPLRGDALLALVLQLVADRTGYPTDMLDPDLDLEADLSIDSIKRIEIIGELADRIGLVAEGDDGIDDTALEELAQLKSLREIVAWIDDLDPEVGTTSPVSVTAEGGPGMIGPSDAPDETYPGVPPVASRYVVRANGIDPPSAERRRLEGTTVVIADDCRGVAGELAGHLGHWGASVSVIAADRAPTEADSEVLRAADDLIWLRALHPDAGVHPRSFDARSAFAWWQPAMLGHATRLLSATAGGGSFTGNPSVTALGLGLAGMAKALSREFTDRMVRVIDLDPAADPDVLAAYILDEFFDTERWPVEVGYDGLQRVTRLVVPESLTLSTPAPAGGGGSPTARTSDPVVLLTGGARGITAHAAMAIAGRGRCRLELAGRSPLPAVDEDPALVGALSLPELRRAMVDTGGFATPADVELACSRVLADREIRATLSGLRQLGAEVNYHQLDVRDAEALSSLVRDIHDRFDRLDLVVHGAGVLDDRLVRDKGADGFERVFATKVDVARTLLDAVGPETDLVFFGSVSGVFGNRGQVDYAAANEALDELAEAANRTRSSRVVTIDWGPWAGTGMVSPELEREYSRRGVGLIDPDEGARALLDELEAQPTGPGRVVVMRALPEALAPEMRTLAPFSQPVGR
jgi:NAD(P)-dependent dehydrogenase (short-subunit alcohol dehydrogenase family)/acyl carrier protein